MSSLGESLKHARNRADLTQREVAKKTGINYKTLSNWENDVSKPSPDDLAVLSTVYDMSTDKLLSGLLGDISSPNHPWYKRFNPPPSYYNDPETQRRMEELMNDPTCQRIFIASKDLKPEELDRIADLMETMAQSRCKD